MCIPKPTTLNRRPPERDGLTEQLAAARSGDVVCVPTGLYKGDFTVPAGVTLQAEAGARVAIDIDDVFTCIDATVRDVEVFSSNTDRTVIQRGIVADHHANLIGCYIHDIHSSGVNWFGSGEAQIVECLITNNGYLVGSSGHGHCIYTHNHGGGARLIARDILLPGYGSYALHGYSGGGNRIADYTVRDVITDRKPNIMGGGQVSNLLYERNFQRQQACYIGRYSSRNADCIVRDNQFAGGAFLEVTDFETAVESGNTTPTETTVIVNPCTETALRLAHVAVFNPTRAREVTVDLSPLDLEPGIYHLRNALNVQQKHTFRYKSEPILLPTMPNRWSAAAPIGADAPLFAYDNRFGAWLLEAA